MSYKGSKELIYSFIVSFFLYLSFSKLNLWFLGYPALFILANLRSFKGWLLSGFFFFFLSLFWVRIAMLDYGGVYPPIAYLLVVLLSLFMTLYQFGFTFLLWKTFRFNYITLPFLWTAVEILRSNFPYGGFPWLLFGELLLDAPLLKYYLTSGGVYLGSVIVWGISLIPLLIRGRLGVLTLLSILLIPIPFIRTEVHTLGREFKVAIVQPNVLEEVKLNERKFYEQLPNYWRILDEVLKHKPDAILLPESAFPFTADELYEKGGKLLDYSESSVIVTGMIDIRFGEGWEPYNSVFVLHRRKVIDFYDKVKLLPFGEYVPFPFGFVKDLFGAIAGMDYIPGKDLRCLRVNGVSIATPICFEISYFGLIRELSKCSDIIAVFTNDGWFRDSDGTFQHLRHARLRALENRKFLLWVNNTGPSAVISPEGIIIKEIPYGKEGFLIYKFQR